MTALLALLAVALPCPLFPADNIWNTPVDKLPLDPKSDHYVRSIGIEKTLHPDFGSNLAYGIPFLVVPGSQARVPVSFRYAEESDPGPYPIPPEAPIEGGPLGKGDRHILVVDRDACRLYELFHAYPQGEIGWSAGSGAIFDLRSNALRPESWTSADAAGLPILPGLVRYDEVAAGAIRHALRFTAERTRRAHVWPARHHASRLTDDHLPPMGQRFRLKQNVPEGMFAPHVRVIVRALKRYGILLADNGADWYLTGAPDVRWNDFQLRQLRQIRGADFEAVDVSSLMADSNSGRVKR